MTGLCQHVEESKATELQTYKIDVMLISKTQMMTKCYIKLPNYCLYGTKHPSGKSHGGIAVIVCSNIKHHELNKYDHDYLQANSVVLEDGSNGGPDNISDILYTKTQQQKGRL